MYGALVLRGDGLAVVVGEGQWIFDRVVCVQCLENLLGVADDLQGVLDDLQVTRDLILV